MLLYLFTLEQEGRSYFGYPIVPAGCCTTRPGR